MTETGKLIQEIRQAFEKVRWPGDTKLLHQPSSGDDSDILEFYGKNNWRLIPEPVLERNYAALSFFSSEAFCFYLPALMIWTLKNYKASDSATKDMVIYNLKPEGTDSLRIRRISRFSKFTAEQRKTIVKFLRFMRDKSDGHSDQVSAADALRNYWDTE